MKRSLTILAILFTTLVKSQPINGIGVIRIGQSQAQILKDLNIQESKIVEGIEQSKRYAESNFKLFRRVYRLRYDPTSKMIKDGYSWDYHKCADAVTYLVPEYEVAGVTLQNFQLVFYRDTLMQISTGEENEAFLNVFKAKYGDGSLDYYSRPYNSSTDCEGQGYSLATTVWKNDAPDIQVKRTVSIGSYADPFIGCNTYRNYGFSIINSKLLNKMTLCNQGKLKSQDSRAVNDKLKDL